MDREREWEEDSDGGLFNIAIDSDEEKRAKENEKKLPRDAQSEAEFSHHLITWKPKVETGEIWKSLKLPLDRPSKPESQTILHAVEELYFLRRYDEALVFVGKALEGELHEEFRGVLVRYQGRCEAKIPTLEADNLDSKSQNK